MSDVDDFLKEAGFLDGLKSNLDPTALGQNVGSSLGRGLGAGAVAVGAGLAVAAAGKIHDAITKSRDFKGMLAYNPDLVEAHEQNQHVFNQNFTTLRSMNPHFTRDPLIAGHYMKQMMDNPNGAGAMAIDALKHRGDFSPGMGQRLLEKGLGK